MYIRKIEKEIRCPLEYGLSVFGGKWKSRIICVLGEKEALRFNELRSHLVNVTDAALASSLKELRRDEIIRRIQYPGIPPVVEYSLTEKGKSLLPILRTICAWSGLFYKETSENEPEQCRKCDYR